MKKLFFLAATMCAAMAMNAAEYALKFTEAVEAGALNGKTIGKGLTLSCVDEADKQVIDANNCFFGNQTSQVKFEYRLKTGGKSQVKTDQTNSLTLTIPEDGRLYIYARNSSKNTAGRILTINQNSVQKFSHEFLDSDADSVMIGTNKQAVFPVYECDVEAGEAILDYSGGAINIYGFSLNAPMSTGWRDVVAEKAAAKRVMIDGRVYVRKANGEMVNILGF